MKSSKAKPYAIDTCLPQKKAVKSGKIKLCGISHGHYPGVKIPPKFLPGLSSLGFWDAVGNQDWGLEPHRNEGIEIVFLETGQLTFSVNNAFHNLKAGHYTVTQPWQLHCHGRPFVGPGRLHWAIIDVGVRHVRDQWEWPAWIMLTRKDLSELTRKLRGNKIPVRQGNATILNAFKMLSAQIQEPNLSNRSSYLVIGLNQLLLGVLESLRLCDIKDKPCRTSRSKVVEQFFENMISNTEILAAKWTLESMAKHCGLGVTVFVKYCHAITNTSPMDYLNRCRLKYAASLLLQKKERQSSSITQVAFQCGFSSSQYFATQFKQHFGCTPQKFRSN